MLTFMNSKLPQDWQISDKKDHIFQKRKFYEISIYIYIYIYVYLVKISAVELKVNKQKKNFSFSTKKF